VVCASAITLFPTGQKAASSSKKIDKSENDEEPSSQDNQAESSVNSTPGAFRLYRKNELNRIVASLLANGSILVAGEEGSGKTVLAQSVVEKLQDDGFLVADVQPATRKQMLLNIAEQLGVETYSLEGKAFTADQLKVRIATFLQDNTAFIIVDECHRCDGRFRYWLKQLQKQGVPMLLLATNPPRTDVFLSIPRIELSPLPQYAIREIMETAALERGINLKNSELAKLQERAGGNPMLAIRAIDEEYLGLEMEAADHGRYFDITPLILLAGIGFAVLRFIGMGTNDHALYIFSGIAAAVFLGFSRLLYNLPEESRRIQR
jgi:hypothetical protein